MTELDANGVASLVLRALPDASVMVFDANLQIVLIAGRPLPGAARPGVQIEPRPVSQALGPERWKECERLFVAALDGRSGTVESQTGADRQWHLVQVEPLRDREDRILGGVCFWREITERKLLVKELEQRDRLIDLAHDAIIVRAPADSSVTLWNREAQDIYGYTTAEAQGRITHELLATEFPHSREAVDEALLAHGRWEGELRHVRKDGRRILVSSRQALVRGEHGEPQAVIELNSDITERDRAERALRTAEERFRGLVESAPDAMVIVDEEGVIELANAQAEVLFGYAREELTGHPVEMLLSKGLRRRHALHRQAFLEEPRARPMGAGIDLLARRKDGSEFIAEISLSPMQTDTGLLISTAIRDVSKQLLRQLEQALVPRVKISAGWDLAWRYRPTVNSMLLGGDFIGVCERPGGSLALLIGDVTGHGPAAAGTGAMLRAAWLGAAQAGIASELIPELLHRLLVNQVEPVAATLATICLADVDPSARELRLIRAGHDAPLLITPGGVAPLGLEHGPALGLSGSHSWPSERMQLPDDAAIMLFTDGLTECRTTPRSARLGYDALLPRIDAHTILDQPPGQAIDGLLGGVFPHGTEHLDDDLAVVLLNLRRTVAAANPSPSPLARSA